MFVLSWLFLCCVPVNLFMCCVSVNVLVCCVLLSECVCCVLDDNDEIWSVGAQLCSFSTLLLG